MNNDSRSVRISSSGRLDVYLRSTPCALSGSLVDFLKRSLNFFAIFVILGLTSDRLRAASHLNAHANFGGGHIHSIGHTGADQTQRCDDPVHRGERVCASLRLRAGQIDTYPLDLRGMERHRSRAKFRMGSALPSHPTATVIGIYTRSRSKAARSHNLPTVQPTTPRRPGRPTWPGWPMRPTRTTICKSHCYP